ncbi:MAG: class I SAM-dependent methyltransferase [Nannocystaceae bacterium]
MAASEDSLDYDVVRRYFDNAGHAASAAASYMAHGQDLPDDAMRYRFKLELRTLADWLDAVPKSAAVLDIGCGAGAWTTVFAARYARVVGIEGSSSMVATARACTQHLTNTRILEGDARIDVPQEPFQLAFLGGLCMYLNDDDVVALLIELDARLASRGPIILRESTVPDLRRTSAGGYQAVYRTVEEYHDLFRRAGFSTIDTRRNYGYTAMEMAIELVGLRRKWFPFVPKRSKTLGWLTWWSLRVIGPMSFGLLPRLLGRLRIGWPPLQNHFFRVIREPRPRTSAKKI